MNCSRVLKVSGVFGLLCAGLAGMLAAAEPVAKTTLENLQAAYGNESAAKASYKVFAIKAREDGYVAAAVLFRALAASENLRAAKFADAIKKLGGEPKTVDAKPPAVNSTKENLESVLKTLEGPSDYAAFAKQAESEKNSGAAMAFHGTTVIKADHAKLVKQALAGLDGWKAADKSFAVCQVCGEVVMGDIPAKCPICAAPKSKFEVVK